MYMCVMQSNALFNHKMFSEFWYNFGSAFLKKVICHIKIFKFDAMKNAARFSDSATLLVSWK